MRNLTATLSALLAPPATDRALSRVAGLVGKDVWLVADALSGTTSTVTASGLSVGDYVLHERQRVINNLGPVSITVVSV